MPHAQEFAESVPREELGGGDGGRSRAKEGGGGAGERPASAEGSSSLAYEEDFIPEDEGSGTSGLAERYGYDARAQAARHVDEGQDDGLAHVYRYREEEASAAGQEVPDWGRDDGYGGDGRRRGDRKDVLRPNTTGHSLTLKAPVRSCDGMDMCRLAFLVVVEERRGRQWRGEKGGGGEERKIVLPGILHFAPQPQAPNPGPLPMKRYANVAKMNGPWFFLG